MADLPLDTSLPNLQPQLNPVVNAPAQPQSHGLFGGLNNVLGRIGDALLIANGAPPMHYLHAQEQQQRSALANYLGQIDPSMGDMINNGVDAGTALTLYKIQHPSEPDFVQELRAAGIDPASEQGKQALMSHITGATDDGTIREYNFAQKNGYGGSFTDFLNLKQGPLIANNGDGTFTIVPRQMVGGGTSAPTSGEITATNPKTGQKLRLNPQTNQWEPLGGATGSTPSPTFR